MAVKWDTGICPYACECQWQVLTVVTRAWQWPRICVCLSVRTQGILRAAGSSRQQRQGLACSVSSPPPRLSQRHQSQRQHLPPTAAAAPTTATAAAHQYHHQRPHKQWGISWLPQRSGCCGLYSSVRAAAAAASVVACLCPVHAANIPPAPAA